MRLMKANNLKSYDYFEYLLNEIPKHMDNTDYSFSEDLLPWSPNLPERIKKHERTRDKEREQSGDSS